MSCYSSSSLEGGCPSSAEVIEEFIQFEGLYSLFSAVERFTYLRDFLNNFGLIDFLSKIEKYPNLSVQRFLDGPAGQTSSLYLKPRPVCIFEN